MVHYHLFYDLVGAYDVGHPACLLVNTIPDNLGEFIAGCQQVGLTVQTIVSIMTTSDYKTDIPVKSIYSLPNIIKELHKAGHVTTHQMQSVMNYLTSHIAQSRC
jgi:hypothetical protein